jgi:hypothetical protein
MNAALKLAIEDTQYILEPLAKQVSRRSLEAAARRIIRIHCSEASLPLACASAPAKRVAELLSKQGK